VVSSYDWSQSADLHETALGPLPGGVNSNVRLSAPALFFERGAGAWLWDVDGNDYVDYLLGQGPSFLGHAHPAVNDAVARACRDGMVFGAQNTMEIEAADVILTALGWAEMVRFGMTGTECVQAALRLARAATSRAKFVRFEGHYHGWLDNMLLEMRDGKPEPASRGQLAGHLLDSYVIPWNDVTALSDILSQSGEQIAAVIMEPVMLNAGAIEPEPGYLQSVRDLCDRHGVVLIFDEVITGFRIHRAGAAGRYGVRPDLATYGKALAGGWPVAALAGRSDLMSQFSDGTVNHSGTFNGSVMAAAAVIATQRVLDADPPYERIGKYGSELMSALVNLAQSHGTPLRGQGLGPAFHLSFGPAEPVRDFRQLSRLDLAGYASFSRVLARHGIWVAARGVWYVSTQHGERELRATVERFEKALAASAG
jgi:glutamate-1-semialdehyde 2,1-aminomutase